MQVISTTALKIYLVIIFRAKVDRKKDGMLEVCPDILCENVKEAEHLAATLALYHLCKGQVGVTLIFKS